MSRRLCLGEARLPGAFCVACIEAANKRRGLELVKCRRRDPRALDYALYVLVKDSSGNRRRGAQAPISALARGEGITLAEVA